MAKGWHNDTHALHSLREQVKFVLAEVKTLRIVDRAGRLEAATLEAKSYLDNNKLPPPWLMTKLEQAYERTIAALYDAEAVKVKIDPKRRGLKFG